MKFLLPHKFPLLPRRRKSDKSDYGHVLVLAGSRGLTGAAVLASEAALKSGSGLVSWALPEGLLKVVRRSSPEIMKLELPRTKEFTPSLKSYPKLFDFIQKRKINSAAVGPGLSQNSDTTALVRKLVENISVPVVLDADGLNSFRGRARLFCQAKAPLVLTPHKSEFERLFLETLPQSESRRIQLAKRLSKFYHVVLVIKGHRTLVVENDKVYQNRTGNPGMAKGGTGDVLTGIIASFIAQGLDSFLAALWAVYFHGKAGDFAVRTKGELSLTATDIIRYLPRAFRSKK